VVVSAVAVGVEKTRTADGVELIFLDGGGDGNRPWPGPTRWQHAMAPRYSKKPENKPGGHAVNPIHDDAHRPGDDRPQPAPQPSSPVARNTSQDRGERRGVPPQLI
jgi:hypothetical protein